MRIAVIGANGQLGTDLVRAFSNNNDEVCALTHFDIEISDINSVSRALKELRPTVIVNTAAMHHVENCEREPEKAFTMNAFGPRNLALIAYDLRAALIHVSTDYVFDGANATPYVEEDSVLPLNVYGNTKLSGEYYVRTIAEKHLVVRTSALYGKNPCRGKAGLNFLELMLKQARERGRVRVVDNEFVTPTFTEDLAEQIVALSRSDCSGLFHATPEGGCSWFEFAREIFSLTKTDVVLEAANPGEFPAKVRRPTYSVLENRALKSHGLNRFDQWQRGLRRYLGLSKSTTAIPAWVAGSRRISRSEVPKAATVGRKAAITLNSSSSDLTAESSS